MFTFTKSIGYELYQQIKQVGLEFLEALVAMIFAGTFVVFMLFIFSFLIGE